MRTGLELISHHARWMTVASKLTEAEELRRMSRRITLRNALTKLQAKASSRAEDPRAAAWRARIEEYTESLSRLESGLAERPNDAPVGVAISVPQGGAQ